MKLLALDTSTEACSVALSIDGHIESLFELVHQRHSERILPLIDAVMAAAACSLKQLDAIAFGRGPGSFTGLRIGAGVVQGLAFGIDVPVVPVSSLAALAQAVAQPRVWAAFDARMGQVYCAPFVRDAQDWVATQGVEQVLAPSSVTPPPGAHWVGVGSGWDRYSATLLAQLAPAVTTWLPSRYPHAREVARLGAHAYDQGVRVAAELALPVYVRDQVAKKQSEQ